MLKKLLTAALVFAWTGTIIEVQERDDAFSCVVVYKDNSGTVKTRKTLNFDVGTSTTMIKGDVEVQGQRLQQNSTSSGGARLLLNSPITIPGT